MTDHVVATTDYFRIRTHDVVSTTDHFRVTTDDVVATTDDFTAATNHAIITVDDSTAIYFGSGCKAAIRLTLQQCNQNDDVVYENNHKSIIFVWITVIL